MKREIKENIFLIENVKIYPHQYVWFNTPSRVFNLSKNFELDYWGVGGRDLANNISILNKNISKKPCVLANPPWLIKSFLDQKLYSCYGLFQDVDSGFPRPFWVVQNLRNLKNRINRKNRKKRKRNKWRITSA